MDKNCFNSDVFMQVFRLLLKMHNMLVKAAKVILISMSNILNIFLMVVDKFMPEMHLKQPEFTNTKFEEDMFI